MKHNVEATKSRKKKLWTVVGVGALAAAVAGGGALSTLYTSIAGNEFRAPVIGADQEVDGSLLVLSGDPIDYTFDSTTYNDQVQASWVLENQGELTTQFEGQFETLANVDEDLAAALTVQYGVVDAASGEVTSWRDGGSLASPRTFSQATGIDAIDGGETIPVAVRVILEDPSLIATEDAEQLETVLQVVADFTVSYMDPLERA